MRVLVQVARRMELPTWHWNFSPSMRIESRAVVRAEVQEDMRRDGQRGRRGGALGRGARRNRDAYDF